MTSAMIWRGPFVWPFPPHSFDVWCSIYVIRAARDGCEPVVLYVGQSAGRLVERLGAHFGSRCLIRGFDAYRDGTWAISVTYAVVPGAREQADANRGACGRRSSRLLLEAERRTIAELHPLLNQPDAWTRRSHTDARS